MPNSPLVNSDLQSALAEVRQACIDRNPKSLARHEEACEAMPGGNTRTVLYYRAVPADAWSNAARAAACGTPTATTTSTSWANSPPACLRPLAPGDPRGDRRGARRRLEPGRPHGRPRRARRAICDRFPSIDLVRFTNSGTEANLMALAAARAAHRPAQDPGVRRRLPRRRAVLRAAAARRSTCRYDFVVAAYNDIAAHAALVAAHGDDLAAILVEPMLGGRRLHPGDPRVPRRRCATLAERARRAPDLRRGDDLAPVRRAGCRRCSASRPT